MIVLRIRNIFKSLFCILTIISFKCVSSFEFTISFPLFNMVRVKVAYLSLAVFNKVVYYKKRPKKILQWVRYIKCQYRFHFYIGNFIFSIFFLNSFHKFTFCQTWPFCCNFWFKIIMLLNVLQNCMRDLVS